MEIINLSRWKWQRKVQYWLLERGLGFVGGDENCLLRE